MAARRSHGRSPHPARDRSRRSSPRRRPRSAAAPRAAPAAAGASPPGAAGGAASAVLVTAALFGFGVLDRDAAQTASQPRAVAPTVGGARPNGDVQAIYESAREGVVSVRTGSGSGTGFVVDRDGTLVTNAHVVGDSDTVQVQFADDETAQARVAGVDRSSDLAVLEVDTGETGPLHALELADSDGVRTGQLAVAIGSPFGLPQTATAGIVSGTGRHIQAPDGFQIDRVIQTDAPINPGNSGGPLLDARGRVIGVNSQIATGGSGNGSVGIGFAVPANTVADVVPRLERGETIQRPFLGVSTAQGTGGALVREVTAGGPAADAGVRAGDVIVQVGGERVQEPDDVAGGDPGHAAGRDRRGRGPPRRRRAHARGRARQPRGADAMSFQQPLLLLALLAVPAAVAFYLRPSAAGAAASAPSPRPPTAASVLPRRPGWRRHVPPALGLIALAGLLAALARPQVSVAVPAEQASIVLAMDHSGSMQATDVEPSRLAATVAAGERFLEEVPDEVRVGGVVFDHRAEAVQAPTRDREALRHGAAREDARLGRHRHRRRARDLAGDAARAAGRGRAPPARRRRAALRRQVHPRPRPAAGRRRGASAMGIPSTRSRSAPPAGTLPDGERVPPDTEALREIAERSGGRAFTAEQAGALQRGLRAARLAGRDGAPGPRGHRGVRRRRAGAAGGRQRPVAAAGSAASSELQERLRKGALDCEPHDPRLHAGSRAGGRHRRGGHRAVHAGGPGRDARRHPARARRRRSRPPPKFADCPFRDAPTARRPRV